MIRVIDLADSATAPLDRAADWLLPTLARFGFAAVLSGYFWSSGLTKFDSIFVPSVGAYAQIFPKAFEAAGYDTHALGLIPYLIALFAGWAEVVLPLLIVIGLMTRLSALGMIGFAVVQSLTDVIGHMADSATIGAWFDRASDAVILDQRTLWVILLAILVLKGAGPLSLDRVVRSWLRT
jgi:putative oxidoreductase